VLNQENNEKKYYVHANSLLISPLPILRAIELLNYQRRRRSLQVHLKIYQSMENFVLKPGRYRHLYFMLGI